MKQYGSLSDFKKSLRNSYSETIGSKILSTLIPYKLGKVKEVKLIVTNDCSDLQLPKHDTLFNLYIQYNDRRVPSKLWEIENTVLLTEDKEIIRLQDPNWSSQNFKVTDNENYMQSLEMACK